MTNRTKLKDDVYMKMADSISALSRDENTHIGCVIVAVDGTPVSWGYNGTMAGISDHAIPHSRNDQEVKYIKVASDGTKMHHSVLTNKYPWMRHAERNAIKYADPRKLKGATLYINAHPCKDCALEIADSGIARIVIQTSDAIDDDSSVHNDTELSEAILAQKLMSVTLNGQDIKLLPN